jgi:hypothetical protein
MQIPRHVDAFFRAAKPVSRIREIAALVGLSARTLRREIGGGELKAFKIGRRNGGDWACHHDDARAYVLRVLGVTEVKVRR